MDEGRLTVSGLNLGTETDELELLLADGLGFADLTSAAGSQLTATVFQVGSTRTGPVTLIRGKNVSLVGQFVSNGGVNSNSSLVTILHSGIGQGFGSFDLGPSSSNAVSAKSGSPVAGGLSPDLGALTGNGLLLRLASRVLSTGHYTVYEARIDFASAPTAAQRAQHLAHLNSSFGAFGVAASATGTTVLIATSRTSFESVVIAGI